MKAKYFSILSIPYLTFCGGLYHLSFWSTFNINGLSIISVTDIIKSSIYPIVTFSVFVVFGMLIGESIFNFDTKFPSGQGRNTKVGKVLNSKILLTLISVLWIAAVYALYFSGIPNRWIIWAFLVSSVPTTALNRYGLWLDTFENKIVRAWAIRILVLVPAFSFSAGKQNSEEIQRNINFQYVITTGNKTLQELTNSKFDTLKLLGIGEQFTFLSDVNNSQIYMINNSNINSLTLVEN